MHIFANVMIKTTTGIIKKLAIFAVVMVLSITAANAQETGKASYYSHRLHGVKMSDGTKYHRDSMTCAHKTYPLGTTLKVTNLNNGKEVYVQVTDRGPHGRGRIVDLSYAAAKELDIVRSGIASVSVEKVEPWIPFKDIKSSGIPQLKLADPNTGEYVSFAEAKAITDKELEKKTQRIAVTKVPKVKKAEPRYRIMRNVLSAKSK